MQPEPSPQYRTHTTNSDVEHRAYYEAPGDSIELREPDGEDGVFEVRMPIATTGGVRNEGDEPLTRSEIEGMAQQIGDGVVSVFPDHGQTSIGGPSRYSIGEKGGEWTNAEVVSEQDAGSDAAELVATARLMDPDTLQDIPIRGMLGSIKSLVERDMSIPASIGWRADENAPGGNDLMEASMVGIGADPRTVSGGGAGVVARAAVEAGVDPDTLLESVRSAVRSPSLGHTYGPMEPELSHEGVSLSEGELYCHETGEVNDVGGPRSEIECPACNEVLDGTELMADLNESQSMTNESDESDTVDSDAEQSDEPDETQDAPDWASRLLELQEAQTETLNSLADALREDDEDEDEDDEDEENASDEDDDEEEDDEEQSSEQSAEDSELEERLSKMEDALSEIRSGESSVESPGAGDDETTTTEERTESETNNESSDDESWRDLV